MYYVYLLESNSDYYTGYTMDFRRRFAEHNSGLSDYTRGRQWNLLYYEAYVSKKDAIERERQLKRHANAMTSLKRRLKHTLSQK